MVGLAQYSAREYRPSRACHGQSGLGPLRLRDPPVIIWGVDHKSITEPPKLLGIHTRPRSAFVTKQRRSSSLRSVRQSAPHRLMSLAGLPVIRKALPLTSACAAAALGCKGSVLAFARLACRKVGPVPIKPCRCRMMIMFRKQYWAAAKSMKHGVPFLSFLDPGTSGRRSRTQKAMAAVVACRGS